MKLNATVKGCTKLKEKHLSNLVKIKTNYNKLFMYMHALLNSNLSSTISFNRDWIDVQNFQRSRGYSHVLIAT